MESAPIGMLLLAAGESSRMGEPKQLLVWQGETFLARAIREALTSDLGPLAVVTGAWQEQVGSELERMEVSFYTFFNPDWSTGMGSSIRCGVEGLLARHPELKAILIFLVDQVYITQQSLNELTRLWRDDPQKIVAARYGEQPGVPAVFPRSFFSALKELPPTIGARKVLRQAGEDLLSIDLPEGALDVDTPEDYQRLINRE